MNELFPETEAAHGGQGEVGGGQGEVGGGQQLLQQARAVQARQQLAARQKAAAEAPTAQQADAAALARRQAALLNPQFVAAVRQKLQSPDFHALPLESQQKLLQLRQQIQRAAVVQQQLQRSNGHALSATTQPGTQLPTTQMAAAQQTLLQQQQQGQGQGLLQQAQGQAQGQSQGQGQGQGGGGVWPSRSFGGAVGEGARGGRQAVAAPFAASAMGTATSAGGAQGSGGVYMGGLAQQQQQQQQMAQGRATEETAVGVKRERDASGGDGVQAEVQESKGERHKRMLVSYMKDTQRALRPDYRTPFSSSEDVCQRLLAYHKFSQVAGRTDTSIKTELEAWKAEYPKKCEELLPRLKAIAEVDIASNLSNAACGTPEEGYLAAILERYEAAQHLKDVRAQLGAQHEKMPNVQHSLQQQPAGDGTSLSGALLEERRQQASLLGSGS